MSYRSLPSNIDRMKAAEVIVSQHVVLTRLLKHDLPNIAGKLYSKSIITAAVHDDALNQFNGAGIRTMSLLSAVEDGIRSEARVFAEFIEILESEPTLRSQANVLVKKYCQESGGIHRAPRVPPAHPMATQSAPPSDIDPYLEQIPLHNRWKLDKELDYDNEYDRDLVAVAENMINWEVYLKVPLGLTEADVYRIKQKRDSVLRQRKVLHIWKEKQTFDATYRKLLRCVVAGKDHKTAKKICDLDIFKGTPLQRGNLGGSQGYQQPTGRSEEVHRVPPGPETLAAQAPHDVPDAGFSQVTHRNPGSRVGNDEQVVVAQAPHQDPPDAAAGDQDKKDKFIVGGVVSLLFGAGMIIYGVVQSKTEYIIGGISFLATGLVALGVILIQRFRKK